jgi:hypothetical protein
MILGFFIVLLPPIKKHKVYEKLQIYHPFSTGFRAFFSLPETPGENCSYAILPIDAS